MDLLTHITAIFLHSASRTPSADQITADIAKIGNNFDTPCIMLSSYSFLFFGNVVEDAPTLYQDETRFIKKRSVMIESYGRLNRVGFRMNLRKNPPSVNPGGRTLSMNEAEIMPIFACRCVSGNCALIASCYKRRELAVKAFANVPIRS